MQQLINLNDFDKLDELLKKSKKFRPKKYKSNTNNFIKLIESEIDEKWKK